MDHIRPKYVICDMSERTFLRRVHGWGNARFTRASDKAWRIEERGRAVMALTRAREAFPDRDLMLLSPTGAWALEQIARREERAYGV